MPPINLLIKRRRACAICIAITAFIVTLLKSGAGVLRHDVRAYTAQCD